MTTIAYRNGFLAADTRAYSGGPQPMGQKQKINRVQNSDGLYSSFGISTAHPGLSEEVRDWFLSDKETDHEPVLNGRSFEALEILSDGRIFYYHDSFVPAGPLTGEYFAIGTGSEYALGAMALGASATEAVQIGAQFDAWTGGVVQHVSVFPDQEVEEVKEIEDAEIVDEAA